jgi:hypothetical protein
MHKRRVQAAEDDGELILPALHVMHKWLIGTAQTLQTMKNQEAVKSAETAPVLSKEEAAHSDNTDSANDANREQGEKECQEAMEEEIVVEQLFTSKARGSPQRDSKPSKAELEMLSRWVVEEMGRTRSFIAVNDKSWMWQMSCLLPAERRAVTTYKQCEVFMLGAVKKRLEKGVREREQEERVAKIVDVFSQRRAATSHGQENIPIAEVIDVEADDSILLGTGESQEADREGHEGTSHAQEQREQERAIQQAQDGSESVVSLSVVALPILAGNEGSESHPPMRKDRSMTPLRELPKQARSTSPKWDKPDPAFERQLRMPMSRDLLRVEIEKLRDAESVLRSTNESLERHVKLQQHHLLTLRVNEKRLEGECECLAAFVRKMPEEVKSETLLTFEFPDFLQAAVGKHVPRWEKARLRVLAAMKLSGQNVDEDALVEDGDGDEEDAKREHLSPHEEQEDEENRTPSPVEQGAKDPVQIEEKLAESASKDELEQQAQEIQKLSELQQAKAEAEEQMLAPKQEERQSLILQADNEKSAKRNHGSSDDSDAGNDKPDAQRMKGEHGAVARGKSKRSNRWGTAGNSSGK